MRSAAAQRRRRALASVQASPGDCGPKESTYPPQSVNVPPTPARGFEVTAVARHGLVLPAGCRFADRRSGHRPDARRTGGVPRKETSRGSGTAQDPGSRAPGRTDPRSGSGVPVNGRLPRRWHPSPPLPGRLRSVGPTRGRGHHARSRAAPDDGQCVPDFRHPAIGSSRARAGAAAGQAVSPTGDSPSLSK